MNLYFKKFLYFLVTIYLVTTAVFFAVRLSPGDPVERVLGPRASVEEIKKVREQLHLDKPMLTQYKLFLVGAVKGDLGKSLFKKKDVVSLIVSHFTPTLILTGIVVFLSFHFGVFFGFISAINRMTTTDFLIRFSSVLFLALPIFSLGPLLVLLFAIQFQLFPVSEWGELKHMFLPSLTLVIPLSAILIKVARNKFLEEKNALWITVLLSKGLSNVQIYLRILKVSLPTILNVVAIQLSVLLAGTMVTESIFDIPGVGTLLLTAIQNRDYPIVQGVILYSSIVYMVVYFLIDAINAKLDPRIQGEA
ncbi:MAG: ABC transporter permease [Bacteriovoracaceae bacterium]